jgi:hypothetical protein
MLAIHSIEHAMNHAIRLTHNAGLGAAASGMARRAAVRPMSPVFAGA